MGSGQKGIMLCERPGPSQMDAGPGLKPFLPSSLPSGLEPLGLVPTQKTFPPSLAPHPENFNLKTIAAVRELEQQNREAALRDEERRMAEAAKAESVTAFGAQLRAAILAGEDVGFWRAAKKAETVQQSLEASKARTAGQQSPSSSAGGASPARQPADGKTAAAAAAVPGAREAGACRVDMTSFVDAIVKEAKDVLYVQKPAAAVAAATASPPAPLKAAPSRSDGTAEASTSGDAGAAPTAPAAAATAGTPHRINSAQRGGAAAGRETKAAAAGGGGGGSAAASKPAWALTAEEVARLEDAEEEELLRFADDLDFDAFMSALDDVELQKGANALDGEDGKALASAGGEKAAAVRRNLVKAMNNAAMKRVAAATAAGQRAAGGKGAGDDGDGLSVVAVSEGGASRATAASRIRSEAATAKRSALADGAAGAGAGAGGWEGSTRAADDVARMDRAKAATQEAFEFLRENPELRAVHSPASVRAMIGKTEAAPAAAAGAGGTSS